LQTGVVDVVSLEPPWVYKRCAQLTTKGFSKDYVEAQLGVDVFFLVCVLVLALVSIPVVAWIGPIGGRHKKAKAPKHDAYKWASFFKKKCPKSLESLTQACLALG